MKINDLKSIIMTEKYTNLLVEMKSGKIHIVKKRFQECPICGSNMYVKRKINPKQGKSGKIYWECSGKQDNSCQYKQTDIIN